MRVLGRVEKFRDRLQLDVRSLEASDVDPASLTPAIRRDARRARGLPRVPRRGARASRARGDRAAPCSPTATSRAYPATPDDHHSYAGGLLEHTVGVATLCRETAQLHPRLRPRPPARRRAPARRRPHASSSAAGRRSRSTDEGRLLGHVHLGAAADRAARRGAHRRPAGRARSTASRRTTTRAPRARPRRPSSTTRTSSTRSPRPAGSIDARSCSRSARASRGASRTSSARCSAARSGALRVLFWAQVGGLLAIGIAVAIRGDGAGGLGRAVRDRGGGRRHARASTPTTAACRSAR